MNQKLYSKLDECRLCESTKLCSVINLEPTPAGNNFLTEEEKNLGHEPIFPLEVNVCEDCFHLQLGHIVNPDHLFKNYHFVSGTSKVNIDHFDKYADSIIEKYGLEEGSFILDIGSNDGTNLKSFKRRGMKVLGVDPADNVAKIANQNGIETLPEYFTEKLASEIKEEYGHPTLITSHNVLAHVDDFTGVMKAIKSLMNQETIFIFEVGYFSDVFKNMWFDTIYHEHLDYHTVSPLDKFFKLLGMKLFDVETVDIQGGSIRNYVQISNGDYDIQSSVDRLINEEINSGLQCIEEIKKYQTRIDQSKAELLEIFKELKDSGKTIAGYGAPTKSTTLMNHFEINKNIIDFIIDDNELKQNKFSPLLHIPVTSKEKLLQKPQPDYLVILAWNFAESIIKKVNNEGVFEGDFIIPLPIPKIIKGR